MCRSWKVGIPAREVKTRASSELPDILPGLIEHVDLAFGLHPVQEAWTEDDAVRHDGPVGLYLVGQGVGAHRRRVAALQHRLRGDALVRMVVVDMRREIGSGRLVDVRRRWRWWLVSRGPEEVIIAVDGDGDERLAAEERQSAQVRCLRKKE